LSAIAQRATAEAGSWGSRAQGMCGGKWGLPMNPPPLQGTTSNERGVGTGSTRSAILSMRVPMADDVEVVPTFHFQGNRPLSPEARSSELEVRVHGFNAGLAQPWDLPMNLTLDGRDDFHVVRHGETGCVEGGRDRARPYPHDWVHGLDSCAGANVLYP